MPSIRSNHVVILFGAIIAAMLLPAGVSADTFVAEDFYLGSSYLDSMTNKAVQEALQAKGFYSGPVDGEFAATSKEAVLRFRAAKHIIRRGPTSMKLDKPFVQALFGIPNLSVERWQDEQCLLARLGKLTDAEARRGCR